MLGEKLTEAIKTGDRAVVRSLIGSEVDRLAYGVSRATRDYIRDIVTSRVQMNRSSPDALPFVRGRIEIEFRPLRQRKRGGR